MSRFDYLKTIGAGELSLARIGAAVRRRVVDVPHQAAWLFPGGLGKRNRERLRSYRDIHRGERCFVVANGPSLSSMDLSGLEDEITFGMNRIYRMTEETGFSPTYLVSIDMDSQLEQIGTELERQPMPKFVNWNARRLFDNPDDLIFIKPTFRPRFSKDLLRGIWGGHSVTFACLQLAYWMGIREVVLIGKDHNYQQAGVPGQLVVSDGTEQNHFSSNYYAPGQTWRLPDYRGEELAYEMARRAFAESGGRVLDATVNGKLQVFDKVDFDATVTNHQSDATVGDRA